jgi:hypothetical protein
MNHLLLESELVKVLGEAPTLQLALEWVLELALELEEVPTSHLALEWVLELEEVPPPQVQMVLGLEEVVTP